jgi:hypothetical protein
MTKNLLCHTEEGTWLTVFENWVPSKIFGRKMVEITMEVRKLQYEELRDMYYSPNIIRAMKSIRMRGSGMWHEWGEQVRTEFLWGNLKRWGYLEDIGTDERIILKCIFKKIGWWVWSGLIWLSLKTVSGLL